MTDFEMQVLTQSFSRTYSGRIEDGGGEKSGRSDETKEDWKRGRLLQVKTKSKEIT